jgi:hypothetical protein
VFCHRSNHYSTRSTLQNNEFLKCYIESSEGGGEKLHTLDCAGEREREKKIGTNKLTIEKKLVSAEHFI